MSEEWPRFPACGLSVAMPTTVFTELHRPRTTRHRNISSRARNSRSAELPAVKTNAAWLSATTTLAATCFVLGCRNSRKASSPSKRRYARISMTVAQSRVNDASRPNGFIEIVLGLFGDDGMASMRQDCDDEWIEIVNSLFMYGGFGRAKRRRWLGRSRWLWWIGGRLSD